MKTEVMSISEFMHREKSQSLADLKRKLNRHFKKYGFVYKIVGTTVIIMVIGGPVLAAGSLDSEAWKLYKELIGIGKWIIVFKGGFDIIKMIGNGDLDSAKKSFIGYLLTYLLLLGLPYGLDKVDGIFDKISKPAAGRM